MTLYAFRLTINGFPRRRRDRAPSRRHRWRFAIGACRQSACRLESTALNPPARNRGGARIDKSSDNIDDGIKLSWQP
jgi:hypothetical protein